MIFPRKYVYARQINAQVCWQKLTGEFIRLVGSRFRSWVNIIAILGQLTQWDNSSPLNPPKPLTIGIWKCNWFGWEGVGKGLGLNGTDA